LPPAGASGDADWLAGRVVKLIDRRHVVRWTGNRHREISRHEFDDVVTVAGGVWDPRRIVARRRRSDQIGLGLMGRALMRVADRFQ